MRPFVTERLFSTFLKSNTTIKRAEYRYPQAVYEQKFGSQIGGFLYALSSVKNRALSASDDGKGVKPDDALRARVLKVVNDPALSRQYLDVIGGSAADLVRVLAGDAAPETSPLVPAFDVALKRLAADASLSRGDRITALVSRVDLARLGQPKDATRPTLPEALLKEMQKVTEK